MGVSRSRSPRPFMQLFLVRYFGLGCLLLPVNSFLGHATTSRVISISVGHRAGVPTNTILRTDEQNRIEDNAAERKPCFYRAPEDRWIPRIHLEDLSLGQNLTGKVVGEHLDGKTGPKVYFECGVGRTNEHGDWRMVNGMLRLGGPGGKSSVARKKAARLRRKDRVELYVSRISLQTGRLEVCTTLEDIQKYQGGPKISASSLKPKQELVGTVTRVVSYGVFVDVGANRKGLLHIQKVADLYGRYIDKEQGLEDAGLERGARIKVSVETNERKRLALDFTEDVKHAAEAAATEREQGKDKEDHTDHGLPSEVAQDTLELSGEEAAAWAAYAEGDNTFSDEEYDEDAAIEDALGLGSY